MANFSNINWAFFGTSNFSVIVLEELKTRGFMPSLIITGEDKPKGRKLVLTPPEVKVWAERVASSATRQGGGKIPIIQLKTLRDHEVKKVIESYSPQGFDLFIVASYGKIIPQNILDMPKYKTLNVHPSLLPKLRGASPIKSAILSENETGVTIMRLDAELDHGPIVAQEKVTVANWPPYDHDLEKMLGEAGGKLLAEVLPKWIKGEIKEQEQDHTLATFCGKIKKSDGEINLADNPEKNLRKIRAYHVWPTAYFFKSKTRIIIKRAHIENNELIIEKVVPEGKKEMNYSDFLKGQR